MPAGYGYKRSLTIDSTKCGTANSTDFPVLFSGTYAYLATVANGGKVENANGYDIVVTSDEAGDTVLSHEIEKYTATTGEVVMWVKVPTVSASVNTVIWLWYGNASITTSQEKVTSTWSNGFMHVYHLKDSGGALSLVDSLGISEPWIQLEATGEAGAADEADMTTYYHRVTAEEATAWTTTPPTRQFNVDSATRWAIGCIVVRGCVATGSPIDVAVSENVAATATTTITGLSVTPPTNNTRVVLVGANLNTAGTDSFTSTDVTEHVDVSSHLSTNVLALFMGSTTHATGGTATGDKTATATRSGKHAAHLIALKPSGGTAPTVEGSASAASTANDGYCAVTLPAITYAGGDIILVGITHPPARSHVTPFGDLTNFGATALATGKLDGGAGPLNGTSQYFYRPFQNLSVPLTLSVWFKKTAVGNTGLPHGIFNGLTSSWNAYYIDVNATNISINQATNNTFAGASANIADDTNWHRAVGVFVSTTSRTAYVDGAVGTTNTTSLAVPSVNSVAAGCSDRASNDSFYAGTIDEIHIANVARAASWITAEYNNQNDPATFYTVGAEQTAGVNATVTPAVAALTVTAPSPSLSAGTMATPITAALSISTPSPSMSLGTTVTPAVVPLTTTAPASTLSLGATATPATAPLITTAPAPTLSAGSTVLPAAVAFTTTAPTPTVSAGSTVEPAVVPLTVVTPAPAVSAASVVTPDVVALPVVTPAPALSTGTTVTPAATALTITAPAPTISAAATVEPTVVPLVTAAPAPTVETGSAATVTPAVTALTVAAPAPTVAAASVVTPGAVALPVAAPAPTLSAASTPTPAVVPLVVAAPAPQLSLGADVAPVVAALVVSVPSPGLSAGSTVTPAAVAIILLVPAPSVQAAAMVAPAVAALVVGIPAPTLIASVDQQPGTATLMAVLVGSATPSTLAFTADTSAVLVGSATVTTSGGEN